jgi:HK97 family phage major capsid protein
MSYTDNRTILQKADLALADLTAGGGILKPAQAQKFMRLLIKDSPLMRLATVVPMQSPKQQISKIKFGSRVLRPGQEATALTPAERSAPDLSQVELDAKLFKAEVRLSDEVLEDSIERGELRQTIMEMMAEAISRDMEEVLINGDTLSADPFLAVMDGVLKQATSNIVDAAATPIAKDLLRDMLKTLPSEHLRDKKAMRFMTSVEGAAAAHPALPGEPRRRQRPDGHPAVQPEEHPRRHLAEHPRRVGPRHLRGDPEDRGHAALRREVRGGARGRQGHQRPALSPEN